MSTTLSFLSRGHWKDTAEGKALAVSGCSRNVSVAVRTPIPSGAPRQSWAQDTGPLQPCGLSLVIIFPWHSQHGNQFPKLSCPITSTLAPSASSCVETACSQVVHTTLPHLPQVPTLHVHPACTQRIPNSKQAHCTSTLIADLLPHLHTRGCQVLAQWLLTSSGLAKQKTSIQGAERHLPQGLNLF